MEERKTKRPRGRPKTVDRARTTQLAMVNYWREGLHALSLNQVCLRAEISKPALYREFENEDGLMSAVLAHYREVVVLPLLMFIGSERPFADVLDELIVGMTSQRETPVGCLFTQMRLSLPRLGPMTTAAVGALEQERRDAFEVWYRRALQSAEITPGLAPELAAGYLDTQFTSVLIQMKAGTPPDDVRAQARLAFRALSCGT